MKSPPLSSPKPLSVSHLFLQQAINNKIILVKPINMDLSKLLEKLYQKLLSKKTKEKSERVILWIALVSFVIHLLIIGLIHFNIITINEPSNLLKNPIAAIYTPFSFILVYEVYLLIYYLPKSTSTYISKQYEIIALIIIRRLFRTFQIYHFRLIGLTLKMIYSLPMIY